MKSKRNHRWRNFVDVRLQGQLVARVAIYWIVCQLVLTGTILGFSLLTETTPTANFSVWNVITPALIVSTLVLPLALYDVISFSNRFAGPLSVFRSNFSKLAETGHGEKIDFRRGDFYADITESFNQLCQQRESASAEPMAKREASPGMPPLDYSNSSRTPGHV